MYFRVAFVTRQDGIALPEREPLVITVGGENSIETAFTYRDDDDSGEGDPDIPPLICCVSIGQWPLGGALDDALRVSALENAPTGRRAQKLAEKGRSDGFLIENVGVLNPRFRASIRVVNSDIGEVIRGVTETLSDVLTRSFNALRWRLGVAGNHSPLRLYPDLWGWSEDREMWNRFRFHYSYSFPQAEGGSDITADVVDWIAQTIKVGADEPLAHQLFREAWEQRDINPRSALVIGVAALEAGVKEAAADLVPDTRWLLENLQSPPIDRLLRDFVPLMPARNTFDGAVLPPHRETLKSLRSAINARNKVAHTGKVPPQDETLSSILTPAGIEETLRSIREVLWLIDYYRGSEWAIQRIRTARRPDRAT
jgi:hypothetical protein